MHKPCILIALLGLSTLSLACENKLPVGTDVGTDASANDGSLRDSSLRDSSLHDSSMQDSGSHDTGLRDANIQDAHLGDASDGNDAHFDSAVDAMIDSARDAQADGAIDSRVGASFGQDCANDSDCESLQCYRPQSNCTGTCTISCFESNNVPCMLEALDAGISSEQAQNAVCSAGICDPASVGLSPNCIDLPPELGRDCSAHSECTSNACYTYNQGGCFGAGCSIRCTSDNQCEQAVRNAGGEDPLSARCLGNGICSLFGTGVIQVICQ